MSFWKTARDRVVLGRLTEEAFFAQAAEEMSRGVRRDGLWAKAIALSEGSESLARSKYIGLLADALRDEQYLAHRAQEIARTTLRANKPRLAPLPAAPSVKSKNSWGVWETLSVITFIACMIFVFALMGCTQMPRSAQTSSLSELSSVRVGI